MPEAFFGQKFEKPDSEEKKIQLITHLFDAHVDFLRDSSRFPNPVVNSVFQEIWGFIGQKIIPPDKVVLTSVPLGQNIPSFQIGIVQWNKAEMLNQFLRGSSNPLVQAVATIPEFTGIVFNHNIHTVNIATVFVPENFPELFEDNPLFTLGGIALVGHQVYDFGKGFLSSSEDSQNANIRASAFEAEVLITILRLAKKENIDLQIQNDYQQQLLKDFPNGINSLTPELKYGWNLQ